MPAFDHDASPAEMGLDSEDVRRAERLHAVSGGRSLQDLERLSKPYQRLTNAEVKMLVDIAQPGRLSTTSTSKREAKIMSDLVSLNLARLIRVGNDTVQVAITLRGEELARYFERRQLGIA